jgi:hypothetical protein
LDKLGATGVATIFIKACITNRTIEEVLENFYKESQKGTYVFQHIKWIKIKQPHFYTKTAKTMAAKRNKIVSKFFGQLKKELKMEDLLKLKGIWLKKSEYCQKKKQRL